MSNRPSGGKSGPPAHQNTTAFRHNKHSKKTHAIQQIPISGMCAHCVAVVEWRKKYRKYKPLKAPKKCAMCELRKVHQAYHMICSDCAFSRAVCAKCLEVREILPTTRRSDAEKQAVVNAEREVLQSLRERERRTYLRQAHRSRRAADGSGGAGSGSGDEDGDDGSSRSGGGDDDDDDDDDDDAAMLAAVEAERKSAREWRQQQAMMKPRHGPVDLVGAAVSDSEEEDEDEEEEEEKEKTADGSATAEVQQALNVEVAEQAPAGMIPADAVATAVSAMLVVGSDAAPAAPTALRAAAGGSPAPRPIAVPRKRTLR